jgi:DNA-binding NarL/FixJ family response regulator
MVDDHEMIRRGVRDLIADVPDIEFAGDAASGTTALEGIARAAPDVAIIDLRLPDIDGVELCREIRSRFPDVQCLMYTSYSSDEALVQSIVAGARGYLLKSAHADMLLQAIRTVGAGGSLTDPALSQSLMDLMLRPTPRQPVPLSAQQERVLELIIEGLTNREIAERLSLAEKTVKNYVSTILEKLNVRSRTQAAVLGAKLRGDDDARGSG